MLVDTWLILGQSQSGWPTRNLRWATLIMIDQRFTDYQSYQHGWQWSMTVKHWLSNHPDFVKNGCSAWFTIVSMFVRHHRGAPKITQPFSMTGGPPSMNEEILDSVVVLLVVNISALQQELSTTSKWIMLLDDDYNGEAAWLTAALWPNVMTL